MMLFYMPSPIVNNMRKGVVNDLLMANGVGLVVSLILGKAYYLTFSAKVKSSGTYNYIKFKVSV